MLARHAILAQQQFAYTTGKNSTDITLVIDAMDLLHSGRFDGFCLVSSDSDFTRLAARIREQGVDVYGIGQAKTPESFRQACTRFIFTENFVRRRRRRRGAAKTSLRPMAEAVELIGKALEQLEEDAEGWYQLGTVGQRLTQPLVGVRHPHLRPRQAQRPRRGHRPLRDRPRRPARAAAPEAASRAAASAELIGRAVQIALDSKPGRCSTVVSRRDCKTGG